MYRQPHNATRHKLRGDFVSYIITTLEKYRDLNGGKVIVYCSINRSYCKHLRYRRGLPSSLMIKSAEFQINNLIRIVGLRK